MKLFLDVCDMTNFVFRPGRSKEVLNTREGRTPWEENVPGCSERCKQPGGITSAVFATQLAMKFCKR